MERDWDDDEDRRRREQDALGSLLGPASGGVTPAFTGAEKPPSDNPPPTAPTSTTMPVTPQDQVGMPDPTKNYGRPNDVGPREKTPAGGFVWNQGHDFSAFDTQREQDPAKSAKDAFAMLSNQAPPPPLNDKAALGAWFTQYIQPGMNQLGHQVSSVDGDKMRFKNWQGEFDVDYAQNAGGEGGRLQWGAEGADDATRAAYAPGGTAPSFAGRPGAAPATPLMQGLGGPQSQGDDPLAKIQAEINALMQGGSTPMEQDELRRLLEQ